MALTQKLEFTSDELAAFGLQSVLRPESYIKVGVPPDATYFMPVKPVRTMVDMHELLHHTAQWYLAGCLTRAVANGAPAYHLPAVAASAIPDWFGSCSQAAE